MRYFKIPLFITFIFFHFLSPAYGLDIALEWSPPHVEEDILFYNLYYKTVSSGPPYDGSGVQEGTSPIPVEVDDSCTEDNCVFEITGLSDKQIYYFVITAVYASGAESRYSEQTCLQCVEIDSLWPDQSFPGDIVRIFGSGFGSEQRDSLIFIDRKVFGPGHRKIILWTDTEIRVKLPSRKCRWFKNRDLKMQKIGITVDRGTYFLDSKEVWLEITKPYYCR